MEIKYIKIKDIKPYKYNPRKNDQAIHKVAESIEQFGFKQPLVLDKDNNVVVGHTRLKAAIKLNIDKVPVLIADDLTEQQIKAYRIADNKTNDISEWDFELLAQELQDIEMFTGFDDDEIEDIINGLDIIDNKGVGKSGTGLKGASDYLPIQVGKYIFTIDSGDNEAFNIFEEIRKRPDEDRIPINEIIVKYMHEAINEIQSKY